MIQAIDLCRRALRYSDDEVESEAAPEFSQNQSNERDLEANDANVSAIFKENFDFVF